VPWMTPHPCRGPGCGNLIRGSAGLCSECRPAVRKLEDELRPSAARRGYGQAWRKKRELFLADHPFCMWARGCGAEATEVDHIIPLSQGGADEESNYQALCKTHHSVKTGRVDRMRRPNGQRARA
jgi:5-methylcytosine-specific restriction enzyme A